MRLLHTSDWHLGRGLHGLDLHDAQAQAVRSIIEAVDAHDVEVVVIAGDVFDRAVPPVSAVRLWGHALRELADRVPVIVTSGNHDSAVRLGAGADLYRAGVHVSTDAASVGTPVILGDQHGPVAFYPIPFLDPDIARHVLTDGDEPVARSHASVLGAALDRVRADLERRRADASHVRSVVVAHAFVTAGQAPETSDSERDIRVGGVNNVPLSVFDGIDYVALGHLHGAQRLDGDRVRYSGSPLRYSFSEVHQRKQVLLVDLDAEGVSNVESLELEQPRAMAVVRGTLVDVLLSAAAGGHADDWVQVTITDPERPPNLRDRLLEAFPHLLSMRHEPSSGPLASTLSPDVRVPSAPQEVAAAFVHYVTGGQISDAELRAFTEAFEFANSQETADV
ncbi:MAG TPA: exonuclease SbcCD subunit D [Actinomycetes bacterium]|nr:exonuclease SbcCD subunit D [Actinomycetes bacterium]